MNYLTFIPYLFFVSEVIILIAKRSKKGSTKSKLDSRSLLLLWIVITAGMGIGGYLSVYQIWQIPHSFSIGIITALIGFAIRWAAIIQLGKMFTVDVSIASDHKLKNTGLYKIVRHPSYLGLMLIITGIAVTMNSLLSCAAVIIPIFLALNYRIQVEERALIGEFGQQYLDYKLKVKRLIPGIY